MSGFLAGQYIVVQSIQTGSGALPTCCQWKTGAPRPKESELGVHLFIRLHEVMTLRMSGALPPLTHVYSLQARGQINS